MDKTSIILPTERVCIQSCFRNFFSQLQKLFGQEIRNCESALATVCKGD